MIQTEVSLVLSSVSKCDPEAIAAAIPLRPYAVWYRKPGLVVHGIDEIPAMQWIYEKKEDGSLESQKLVDSVLAEISSCRVQIRKVLDAFGLDATVNIRIRAEDEAASVQLRPELLNDLANMKCKVQFIPDNGF